VRTELIEKGLSPEQAERWLEILSVSGSREELLEAIRAYVPESEGIEELQALFELLPRREEIRFVPSLARGLGYYTGVIFEVYSLEPPFDGSVAAGGRWDELIGNFLGSDEKYPAVGISFGLEPIIELVKRQEGEEPPRTVTQVYVIPIGKLQKEALRITQRLREAGLKADMDLLGKGISDNLRYANSYGIPYVLLIGQEELKQERVKLRDMRSGTEDLLTLEEAIAKLKRSI